MSRIHWYYCFFPPLVGTSSKPWKTYPKQRGEGDQSGAWLFPRSSLLKNMDQTDRTWNYTITTVHIHTEKNIYIYICTISIDTGWISVIISNAFPVGHYYFILSTGSERLIHLRWETRWTYWEPNLKIWFLPLALGRSGASWPQQLIPRQASGNKIWFAWKSPSYSLMIFPYE